MPWNRWPLRADAPLNFERPHADLRELLHALEESGRPVRVRRPINKDTELHPLVRWQFIGLAEEERRAFLFERPTGAGAATYRGSVLVGGLAASSAIYALGLKCRPEEAADRWLYAMDNPVEPEIDGVGPAQEVHLMEPLVNLRPYVVLRMRKEGDEEPWAAMNAVLEYADGVGKLVIAVDEDIDAGDPVAVTWAITHRSQPDRDTRVVGGRPFRSSPIGMVATHPSSRYDNSESALLIDATRKSDFPPVSLPTRPYMERAREIWEELDLPALEHKQPWHGYLLGLWENALEQEAQLAAVGNHERVWQGLTGTRVALEDGETLASARQKWGQTHAGRTW